VLTNGISAMLFTVLWKEIDRALARRRAAQAKDKAA
jgi:hypothetical protein